MARWGAYLDVLAEPRRVRPVASVAKEHVTRVRPEHCRLEVVREAPETCPTAKAGGLVATLAPFFAQKFHPRPLASFLISYFSIIIVNQIRI